MQDRTSRKNIGDMNLLAAKIVDQAIGEKPREKNPAAVALGKLGGAKGGPARAKKLSPEKRRDIAQRAARARWEKYRP